MEHVKTPDYILIELRKDGLYVIGDDFPIIKRTGFLFKKFNYQTLFTSKHFHVRNNLDFYITHNLKKNQWAILDPEFNDFGLSKYSTIAVAPGSSEMKDLYVFRVIASIANCNEWRQIRHDQEK